MPSLWMHPNDSQWVPQMGGRQSLFNPAPWRIANAVQGATLLCTIITRLVQTTQVLLTIVAADAF
jgi:hypothetical protein